MNPDSVPPPFRNAAARASASVDEYVIRRAVSLHESFLAQEEPPETFFRNFISAPANIRLTLDVDFPTNAPVATQATIIYMAYRAALGLDIK